MKSVSGCITYLHGSAVLWKSSRQSVRSYSTQQAEWIAASDLIILEESAGWLPFFCSTPEKSVLWCDSQAVTLGAKGAAERPASRHLAIRWHRVRDEAQRLCFVPTHLQRADGLTKNNVSPSQRRLLLHVVESPSIEDVIDDETAYPVSAYLFSGV